MRKQAAETVDAAPNAVEIDGLTAVYGSGAARHQVLTDVTLTVPRSTSVGLVGESGSGKSTLAKVLVGLVPIASGTLTIEGERLDATTVRRKQDPRLLQLIPQDPYSSLDPRRTAGQALAEALDPIRADVRRRREEIGAWLDRVELPAASIDKYPHEFSGGQRQRIAIARALCIGPRVVIADEITSALDLSVQAEVLELLAQLRTELDLSMLFISHDLAVVRHVSDEVAVLRDGELKERGPVETIFSDPQHPYTRRLLDSVPGGPGFDIRTPRSVRGRGRGMRADTAFVGGRFWTGDRERPWARSVATAGGTVVAIDDDEACARARSVVRHRRSDGRARVQRRASPPRPAGQEARLARREPRRGPDATRPPRSRAGSSRGHGSRRMDPRRGLRPEPHRRLPDPAGARRGGRRTPRAPLARVRTHVGREHRGPATRRHRRPALRAADGRRSHRDRGRRDCHRPPHGEREEVVRLEPQAACDRGDRRVPAHGIGRRAARRHHERHRSRSRQHRRHRDGPCGPARVPVRPRDLGARSPCDGDALHPRDPRHRPISSPASAGGASTSGSGRGSATTA